MSHRNPTDDPEDEDLDDLDGKLPACLSAYLSR
jgi:hypothetical protein